MKNFLLAFLFVLSNVGVFADTITVFPPFGGNSVSTNSSGTNNSDYVARMAATELTNSLQTASTFTRLSGYSMFYDFSLLYGWTNSAHTKAALPASLGGQQGVIVGGDANTWLHINNNRALSVDTNAPSLSSAAYVSFTNSARVVELGAVIDYQPAFASVFGGQITFLISTGAMSDGNTLTFPQEFIHANFRIDVISIAFCTNFSVGSGFWRSFTINPSDIITGNAFATGYTGSGDTSMEASMKFTDDGFMCVSFGGGSTNIYVGPRLAEFYGKYTIFEMNNDGNSASPYAIRPWKAIWTKNNNNGLDVSRMVNQTLGISNVIAGGNISAQGGFTNFAKLRFATNYPAIGGADIRFLNNTLFLTNDNGTATSLNASNVTGSGAATFSGNISSLAGEIIGGNGTAINVGGNLRLKSNMGYIIPVSDGLIRLNNNATTLGATLELGKVISTNGVQFASGQTISNIISASLSIDFGSIPANGIELVGVSTTGSLQGDIPWLSWTNFPWTNGLIISAASTRNGQVDVTAFNPTASPINPPANWLILKIIQFQ